jgi:signal peptidase
MTPTLPRRFQGFVFRASTVLATAYLGLLTSLAVWAVVPFIMGWVPTVVVSGSMEPLIKVGDIVAAERITAAEVGSGAVKVGQVLLADNPLKPGSFITHRVVTVRPDGKYTTKGDAVIGIDRVPTPAANIVGIERYRVPYIGIPVVAMKNGNPAPMAAFITISSAAILVLLKDRKRTIAGCHEPAVGGTP